MRIAVSILALTLAAGAAGAAGIKMASGLSYDPVRILDFAEGSLKFAAPNPVTKPLKEIAVIRLDGNAEFNRAELLLNQGKAADALAAYAAAEKGAGGWQRGLIAARCLQAAEAVGDIEQAARRWLELADAAPGSQAVLDMRPRKMGQGAANDKAIGLLTARLDRASGAYQTAIRMLLADLYQKQGKLDEAQAVLGKVTGSGTKPPVNPVAPGPSPGPGPHPPVAPPPALSSGQGAAAVRMAELAIQRGQYAQAIAEVKPKLRSLGSADLPAGLLALGTAQFELGKAAGAQKGRPLILAGGANLMRVITFNPACDEAPRALLLAGEANQAIGNKAAAQAAFRGVLSRYGQSSSAERARQLLAALAAGEKDAKPASQPASAAAR